MGHPAWFTITPDHIYVCMFFGELPSRPLLGHLTPQPMHSVSMEYILGQTRMPQEVGVPAHGGSGINCP
jgi:hypothetical protein